MSETPNNQTAPPKPDREGETDDLRAAPVEVSLGRRMARFFSRALGYWSPPDRYQAWTITLIVLLFVGIQLGSLIFWNLWNRWFFDALDHKDVPALWTNFALFPLIVLLNVVAATGLLVSRLTLQIRWREWLTKNILGWWIADQRYYRLPFVAEEQTAPEFRISDDVRLAIEPLVDFSIGILTAVVTAGTFATILWRVGGSAHVTLGGTSFDIPAYMAIAAVLYAFGVTVVAVIAGRPLISFVGIKNEAEAQFRAEMTRLRENAESIALIRGDDDERGSVLKNYGHVVTAWFGIVKQNAVVSLVLSTNGGLFPIIPLFLAAPKYVSGELSLGEVMQVTAAFVAVQGALIWFVDNLLRVADWIASVVRVDELAQALEDIDVGVRMDSVDEISLGVSEDGAIHLDELAAAHRNGRIMIAAANVVIEQGEKVLIAGESGTGKSTLIRAIAGLWPWGSGSILMPPGASIAFMPQRPYLPLGSLRNAICYSAGEEPIPPGVVEDALKRCGLNYLLKRLDEEAHWDQQLSGGERQRVAFARLLVQRPSIIVMDEATSALDEDSQTSLLGLVRDELPESTVISVGHRPSLDAFHDRKITLTRKTTGAIITSAPISNPLMMIALKWGSAFFSGAGRR